MTQVGYSGTLKLVVVYTSGVVLGSVIASLFNPRTMLLGASAGVYALIASHLATLILNWKEDGEVYDGRKLNKKSVTMSLNPLIRAFRLAFVIVFTLLDLGTAIYNYYTAGEVSTSYAGMSISNVDWSYLTVFSWEPALGLAN